MINKFTKKFRLVEPSSRASLRLRRARPALLRGRRGTCPPCWCFPTTKVVKLPLPAGSRERGRLPPKLFPA